MNTRMIAKPAKSALKNRTAMPMSPAMQAAMFKVANVAANLSRKDEAARKAIADTVEEWITWLSDDHADAVEEFYYEICMLASAGNRNKIAKHSLMPKGLLDRVEEDLKAQKEEAEREAAKVQSKDDGKGGNAAVAAV
ncbi:hypothetical protein P775_00280 [Puniceibacterium antarcticum]|uniref:Uncharacterized protein n=1 Tax=Puniceibacterium antarcticum TaxID=1206336 RepID=A0A2G8RKX6_9RHOB|nr:hypothetical protein [Puniceibacterium antarcticum]PIL22234.1 hypothetical protein P775_00280 [Puniceibacterium antarcticum]